MNAEPLSREEREFFGKYGAAAGSVMDAAAVNRLVDQYEATVQAAEERAERLREFVTRISGDKWTVWQGEAQRLLAADDEARGPR